MAVLQKASYEIVVENTHLFTVFVVGRKCTRILVGIRICTHLTPADTAALWAALQELQAVLDQIEWRYGYNEASYI